MSHSLVVCEAEIGHEVGLRDGVGDLPGKGSVKKVQDVQQVVALKVRERSTEAGVSLHGENFMVKHQIIIKK